MSIKAYLPELAQLVLGLGVMVALLYMGAQSEGWVALLCFLGTAVVYHSWYRVLLRLAQRSLGSGGDDEEDRPSFPG